MLQGFGGALSPCFLHEITSHPVILLQGRPFTHQDLFSSSLLKLVCIHCCTGHNGNTVFLGRLQVSQHSRIPPYKRCYVKSCNSMLPAASLGTYDGHSSFGPSAACSRPLLKSSVAAVHLFLHGPAHCAGGERVQMLSYKHTPNV